MITKCAHMLAELGFSVTRLCRLAVIGLPLAFFSLTLGCKSYRYAGAPPPSYDVDADLKQLSQHFKPAVAISNYYALANPTRRDRDKVISARLVMINLEYLKWLRTVTADKQLLDTGTDVLILSLNLAATATGGAATKTVFSAISAGVTGSKTAIDKHYYYEKTAPALVAAMNAQRKVVLTGILDGMNMDLEDYSFEQALADVYQYYQAGTFMGAVTSIHADSGAKEKKADEAIAKISKPTLDEKEAVKELQPVWTKLYSEVNSGSVPAAGALRKALQALGEPTIPVREKDVVDRLHEMLQRREKSAVEILKALKNAGYPGL